MNAPISHNRAIELVSILEDIIIHLNLTETSVAGNKSFTDRLGDLYEGIGRDAIEYVCKEAKKKKK